MKGTATLRYADGQYLLTVDETNINDEIEECYYWDKEDNEIVYAHFFITNSVNCYRIIAAENIEGVMKIREFVLLKNHITPKRMNKKYTERHLNTQVPYEIINNEAIIRL